MFTNFKLTADSCRRCGKNTHATTRCPNVVSDAPVPPPDVNAASTATAAKIAADAAKRAAEAAQRAAAKEAKRAAKKTQRAVKGAVFESLEHTVGFEVRNKTCFRASNWDTEGYSLCLKCGKPEPRRLRGWFFLSITSIIP